MRPDRVLGQISLNEADSFRNFIEAMRVAESAARQLAYIRGEKKWMLVSSAIEGARLQATALATRRTSALEHPWLS
jgi:hypothetical protein